LLSHKTDYRVISHYANKLKRLEYLFINAKRDVEVGLNINIIIVKHMIVKLTINITIDHEFINYSALQITP